MWVARRTAEHLRWRWLAQVDPPSGDELVGRLARRRGGRRRLRQRARDRPDPGAAGRCAAGRPATRPAPARRPTWPARPRTRCGAEPLLAELTAQGSAPAPATVDGRREPDPARVRDPRPRRRGPQQRRDRQAALHQHQDRLGPRLQHPRQARRRLAHRGGRGRPAPRPDLTRNGSATVGRPTAVKYVLAAAVLLLAGCSVRAGPRPVEPADASAHRRRPRPAGPRSSRPTRALRSQLAVLVGSSLRDVRRALRGEGLTIDVRRRALCAPGVVLAQHPPQARRSSAARPSSSSCRRPRPRRPASSRRARPPYAPCSAWALGDGPPPAFADRVRLLVANSPSPHALGRRGRGPEQLEPADRLRRAPGRTHPRGARRGADAGDPGPAVLVPAARPGPAD